jgi:hypothetical protein
LIKITNQINDCQLETKRYYAKKELEREEDPDIEKRDKTKRFEKTSMKGTLYEYHDLETSIQYMESEGNLKNKKRKEEEEELRPNLFHFLIDNELSF